MKKPKIEKVKEDYHVDMFQCQRCKNESDTDGWYCENCIGFVEIDFDVEEENISKGDKVCPWCYNQLIEERK
jgi:hypothetical protein